MVCKKHRLKLLKAGTWVYTFICLHCEQRTVYNKFVVRNSILGYGYVLPRNLRRL